MAIGIPTTVLIADDNAEVRFLLRRLLRGVPNIEIVAEAHNGYEAVTLAVQHRPHVVLMDISMPHMNGIDAIRRIRLQAPDVRVIIVTADEDASMVETALAVGADGFVAKRAAPAELAQALNALKRGERFISSLAQHRSANVTRGSRHRVLMSRAPSPSEYAYAHHSITGVYDTRREVAVEGAVTEFHFVSPHPFVLARVDRNGAAEQWRFDMDNRNEMREIGVTADTLRVGDRVAVAGHPAREEPRRLYIQRFERSTDGFSFDVVRRQPRLRRAPAR